MNKGQQSRLIGVVIILLAILGAFAFGTFHPYLAESVFVQFGEKFSLPPRDCESDGLYPNSGKDASKDWSVVVYYSGARRRLGFGSGGVGFREVAQQHTTHRIAASNLDSATKSLKAFYARAQAEGHRVTVVGIMDHANEAHPCIAGQQIDHNFLSALKGPDGVTDVHFLGCYVARGDKGKEYLRLVALAYGIRVSGYEGAGHVHDGNSYGDDDRVFVAGPDGQPAHLLAR